MECFTVTVWTRAVHILVVHYSHDFCLSFNDLIIWSFLEGYKPRTVLSERGRTDL